VEAGLCALWRSLGCERRAEGTADLAARNLAIALSMKSMDD
jgi:hypothetical protein